MEVHRTQSSQDCHKELVRGHVLLDFNAHSKTSATKTEKQEQETRLTALAQGCGVEGSSKNGLMDTDNSVVIAGGGAQVEVKKDVRGVNCNGKNTIKNGLTKKKKNGSINKQRTEQREFRKVCTFSNTGQIVCIMSVWSLICHKFNEESSQLYIFSILDMHNVH